jgi:hypothetical protein
MAVCAEHRDILTTRLADADAQLEESVSLVNRQATQIARTQIDRDEARDALADAEARLAAVADTQLWLTEQHAAALARLAAVEALADEWGNPPYPHDLIKLTLRNHGAPRLRAVLHPAPSEAP